MMAMAQNAFANTSSSMMIAKIQGNIVDVLMPPLRPASWRWRFALGGVDARPAGRPGRGAGDRALLPLRIYIPALILCLRRAASLMLSLLGIVGAIWADKFDHIAAVTNFIVTPLSFLSGTFYSIDGCRRSGARSRICNPFFYMIDGFRYGFIGHADGSLGAGLAVLAAANILLWLATWRLIHKGYKLRP